MDLGSGCTNRLDHHQFCALKKLSYIQGHYPSLSDFSFEVLLDHENSAPSFSLPGKNKLGNLENENSYKGKASGRDRRELYCITQETVLRK